MTIPEDQPMSENVEGPMSLDGVMSGLRAVAEFDDNKAVRKIVSDALVRIASLEAQLGGREKENERLTKLVHFRGVTEHDLAVETVALHAEVTRLTAQVEKARAGLVEIEKMDTQIAWVESAEAYRYGPGRIAEKARSLLTELAPSDKEPADG